MPPARRSRCCSSSRCSRCTSRAIALIPPLLLRLLLHAAILVRPARGREGPRRQAEPAAISRPSKRWPRRSTRRTKSPTATSAACSSARWAWPASSGSRTTGHAQGDRGRRAAARHRQDRDSRAHPQQAGQADARRVREDEAPRADRRGDPLVDRLSLSGRADRAAPPRELGRHRLSRSHRAARTFRSARASCRSSTASTR